MHHWPELGRDSPVDSCHTNLDNSQLVKTISHHGEIHQTNIRQVKTRLNNLDNSRQTIIDKSKLVLNNLDNSCRTKLDNPNLS